MVYRLSSVSLLNSFHFEWRYIRVDDFVEFAGSEMTGKHSLGDDVGRFGVADDSQRLEPSIREGGLEFVIQAVVGDSICDHDDGVAGESRFGVGEGLGHSGSGPRERGESVVWEQSHVQG